MNSASSTFSMAFFSNSRLCLPQKVLDIIVVVWIVAITWLCRQCQQVDIWTIAIIGFEQEEVVAGSDLGGRALQAGASAHLLSI